MSNINGYNSNMPGGFERYIFIDASGQPSLDVEKARNSHFIIVSIIAQYHELDLLSSNLQRIADTQFSGGEIKSSTVGSNDARRLKIIDYLKKVPFNYGAVIIDKRAIDKNTGLIYGTSFFKFCHNILFSHLLSPFNRVFIRLDDYGSTEYMDSFKRYVFNRQTQISFFNDYDVDFIDSKASRFVQLADFLAGTIAKVFDEYLKTNYIQVSNTYWSFLRGTERNMWTNGWPPKYIHVEARHDTSQLDDELVESKAINTIVGFIEKYGGYEDKYKEAQVETLRYLLYSYYHSSKNRHISTKELCNHLSRSINVSINEQTFWRNVAEPIKDEGVLIISSQTKKGYKIPCGIEEIHWYVKQANLMITPQARRINRVREIIKTITGNKIDILESYPHIISLLNKYEEDQIMNH